MCRVANHQTRLPRATSSLALNASGDGASTASLGNLFRCVTTLCVEKLPPNNAKVMLLGLKGPDPSLEKDVGDVMINISSVLVSCVGHQVLTWQVWLLVFADTSVPYVLVWLQMKFYLDSELPLLPFFFAAILCYIIEVVGFFWCLSDPGGIFMSIELYSSKTCMNKYEDFQLGLIYCFPLLKLMSESKFAYYKMLT